MDFRFTAAEEAFRHEARSWFTAHRPAHPLPSMDTAHGFDSHREWERELHRGGWSVVAWPERYGGRGLDLVRWLICEEEYYRADLPGRVNQNGIYMLGPTLLDHGTAEQRARFLPPMARGDELWCQGWSEPDAGSDLAALTSRATRDGNEYVLNGQKTWVSRGAFADWMFGLFRTGSTEDRHRALTFILVPMDADGLTVRPIQQLDGESGFAEVFLEDVRVPVDLVVGSENAGWAIAMATAGFERGVLLRSPGRFVATADRLVDLHLRTMAGDAEGPGDAARLRVADAWMRAQVHRLHTYWTVQRIMDGDDIGAEASLNKIFWSEMDIELHEAALGLLGDRGELTGAAPAAVDYGRWLDGLQFALAGPIYAGSNQIQRNIVADRVLRLPRGS